MSKYIIEIDDDLSFDVQFLQAIGAEPNGVVRIRHIEFEKLEELNSDYINEHFGDLQDTAYQRGLDEAWKAARRISVIELNGGLAGKELMKIYGTMDIHKIYDDNTASEAIAKLKAYEEKQKADDEIKVGDEVIYNGTTKCIVVRPEDDERYASLIDGNGTHHCADHCECKKTGRHFDIASILEEMRND